MVHTVQIGSASNEIVEKEKGQGESFPRRGGGGVGE